MKKKKNDNYLPGYPHYSATDDITANENKVDADLDQLSETGGNLRPLKAEDVKPEVEDTIKDENDITAEDLKIIGDVDQDMDEGEDETLLPLVKMNDDLLGADLDAPGNDYDDEEMNPEDEENNLFSRGQD
ncbi:MAG: hypothetical protein ABI855_07645 [Bacteroidota bacterium]